MAADIKAAEKALLIVGLAKANKRNEASEYVEKLIKSGLTPEHFTGYEASFFSAILSLHLQKRTFSNLDVIQAANSSIPPDYWETIKKLWDDPPELDSLGFIPAVREARSARRVEKVTNKIQQLLRDKPHEIGKWLPQATSALQKVNEDSQSYDSNPRDIYFKSHLPIPFAGTGYKVIDNLLLGGYRYGDLLVFYGFTKSGKSSSVYSLLGQAVLSGLPCALIKGERPIPEQVFQILKSICGHIVPHDLLADKEFIVENYPDDERAIAKSDSLLALSDCLTVHPLESRTTDELQQIIATYKPVLVGIDPLENLRVSSFKGGDEWRSSQMVAQEILNIASSQKHPCTVIGTLQASPRQKEEWNLNHTLSNLQGYGTNAFTMKATGVFMVDKHHMKPNYGYGVMLYRTRQGGAINEPFEWPYDPRRAAYVDEG